MELYERYIDDVVKKFENPDKNSKEELLMHSALGLSSEIGELINGEMNKDKENILEELGDLYYFLFQGVGAIDFDLTHTQLNYTPKDTAEMGINKLIVEVSHLVDVVKAFNFYERELPEDEFFEIQYARIYFNLRHLVNENDFNEFEVMRNNAQKLERRYGEKYSNERANNRE